MSEKEQVAALKLLREWLQVTADIVDTKKLEELRERSQEFLKLRYQLQPESHGQRRS